MDAFIAAIQSPFALLWSEILRIAGTAKPIQFCDSAADLTILGLCLGLASGLRLLYGHRDPFLLNSEANIDLGATSFGLSLQLPFGLWCGTVPQLADGQSFLWALLLPTTSFAFWTISSKALVEARALSAPTISDRIFVNLTGVVGLVVLAGAAFFVV